MKKYDQEIVLYQYKYSCLINEIYKHIQCLDKINKIIDTAEANAIKDFNNDIKRISK